MPDRLGRFPGFPPEGLAFLSALKKNNRREWFHKRKPVFEQLVKAPMTALVEAINAALASFAPHYITDPGKAIYRIYRDTRFSKDKTPLKTHIAATFTRAGLLKHASAGYYFSVAPDQIEVAGGLYMPGPEQLRCVRRHICEHHERLRRLIENPGLKRLMGELWGESLKRTPKGFAAGHPAEEWIRRRNWVFYDTRLDPAIAATPRLLPEIVKRFRAMAPFIDFLNEPLTARRPTDPFLVGFLAPPSSRSKRGG